MASRTVKASAALLGSRLMEAGSAQGASLEVACLQGSVSSWEKSPFPDRFENRMPGVERLGSTLVSLLFPRLVLVFVFAFWKGVSEHSVVERPPDQAGLDLRDLLAPASQDVAQASLQPINISLP